MADLDAGHGACGLDAGGNARHAFDLAVVPQAGASGEMRPSGDTPVASTITSPAPPRAMEA
jgi:hypothetical protein